MLDVSRVDNVPARLLAHAHPYLPYQSLISFALLDDHETGIGGGRQLLAPLRRKFLVGDELVLGDRVQVALGGPLEPVQYVDILMGAAEDVYHAGMCVEYIDVGGAVLRAAGIAGIYLDRMPARRYIHAWSCLHTWQDV